MKRERGLGLLEDDPRRAPPAHVTELVGYTSGHDEASLEGWVSGVCDQNPSDGCVGFAFKSALEILAARLDIAMGPVSALAIYTMAREAMGLSIIDKGSRARDAADALEQRGIVSDERWPFDMREINTPVPWDVFQHAAAAKVDGLYRALGAEAIERAIHRGYPVVFDQTVDQAYDQYTGGVYAEGGRILGRHMQVIVGYDRTRQIMRVLNSWGKNWGENGLAWIPYSIADRAAYAYVITLAPREAT